MRDCPCRERTQTTPASLVFVLGNRAEDAFHLPMIGSGGNLKVFWSNGLVGSIMTLAVILLFWPLLSAGWQKLFGAHRAH